MSGLTQPHRAIMDAQIKRAVRQGLRFHASTIAIAFDGDKPPTRFCLIPWGRNESENGPYIYDEQSHKTVMDGYARRGIECMFDWHHASLDPHPADPKEAIKSAGWYRIESVKGEGLFAVDIRWTPAALEAFANKEIRYFSPAFDADKSGRVVDYINCALTNLPATHNNQPLIAASRRGNAMFDPEDERRFTRLESQIGDFVRRQEERDRREEEEKREAKKREEEARKREEEEKREEARKREEEEKREEEKRKARKSKYDNDMDDEDEDEDEDERMSRHAREDEEEARKREEEKRAPESEEEKRARRSRQDEEAKKSRRMKHSRFVENLIIENARLRAGINTGKDRASLERRYMSLVSRGLLQDSPSNKRFLCANPASLDRVERELGGIRREYREGYGGEADDIGTHQVKLAREIGTALGNDEVSVQKGLSMTRRLY